MRLTPRERRDAIRNATNYGKTKRASRGGLFRRLGREFGSLGELIGMVADIMAGGRRPSRRQILDAINLLTQEGFSVRQEAVPPPIETGPPPIQRPQPGARPAPPPITTRRVPPSPTRPAATPWPAERPIQVMPTRVRGMYDMIPSGVEGVSPEILTPESSNVYSIQYDYEEQMLYVRFNANADPIGHKTMRSVCTGKPHRVGIRPHEPGPLYSYGGRGSKIGTEMFDRFVAARSKGQFVWSHLRVCGSPWSHQYPYTMVQGEPSGYVARKATRRGLAVRTVPIAGAGRRGGAVSTLPARPW